MEKDQEISVELALSPEGHVYLNEGGQASERLRISEAEEIRSLFASDVSKGLLHLGIQDFSFSLPASFLFWQTFSRQFVAQLCKIAPGTALEKSLEIPLPDEAKLQEMVGRSFGLRGSEYLNESVLYALWKSLAMSLKAELHNLSVDVQQYLQQLNSRWNLVGRVCFHLAENKANEARPFAFLATYTTQLSQAAQPQHLPLKRVLQEYAGEKNHAALLALLLPVQKAASQSGLVKELVDSGSIFQALSWTAHEAHRFLKETPLMESSGIVLHLPNWWRAQSPPRAKVVVTLGAKPPSVIGLDTLLDFSVELMLADGERISIEDWESLFLNSSGDLLKFKGQWVEVDREKLQKMLSHWSTLSATMSEGLSMSESLRLLAGSERNLVAQTTEDAETLVQWSKVTAGGWFKDLLDQLRNPETVQDSIELALQHSLKGTLRPYQRAGVKWLWLLYQLKLGGCLADDMGLGKTIQVLSVFLLVKSQTGSPRRPHLLVVPASLLGNWQAEAARFAPTLRILLVHPLAGGYGGEEQLAQIDIVITTYALTHRLTWLQKVDWDLLVLDEAQLIKNPGTKQTRAVKELKSQVRFVLTGTPIENRLSDLWSLFDFTSPGLLGGSKAFTTYSKRAGVHFASVLRSLTQPYILRRLKSDKSIISDLPDKTEMQTFCLLSKEQVRLYQRSVEELVRQLKQTAGLERRGLILAYLMRFKQICNHPTQLLGYGEYTENLSGKFARLREICQEIAAKQEKVLVFTQFREIIPAIASHLTKVFGREGLTLDGSTAMKKRSELVASFQMEQGPPFFVLSLQAGGTGLNLTRATHVVHFDRWWNPAVENQATDRAYRIGQQHPVLVHKFICLGTIEEKIDTLINSKKNISEKILEGENELLLTEISDEELLNIVSLDIQKAIGDG